MVAAARRAAEAYAESELFSRFPAAQRAAATKKLQTLRKFHIVSAMERPPRKRLEHVPPDWVRPEADFFITVCADPRGANHFCNETTAPGVIESIRNHHDRGVWYCHLAVLMPDHIHLILNFPSEKTLARIVGEWKGWLGRHRGISWQRNFFDHRIRSETDRNKGDYILQNPVRAGLVQRTEDWPYKWTPDWS